MCVSCQVISHPQGKLVTCFQKQCWLYSMLFTLNLTHFSVIDLLYLSMYLISLGGTKIGCNNNNCLRFLWIKQIFFNDHAAIISQFTYWNDFKKISFRAKSWEYWWLPEEECNMKARWMLHRHMTHSCIEWPCRVRARVGVRAGAPGRRRCPPRPSWRWRACPWPDPLAPPCSAGSPRCCSPWALHNAYTLISDRKAFQHARYVTKSEKK